MPFGTRDPGERGRVPSSWRVAGLVSTLVLLSAGMIAVGGEAIACIPPRCNLGWAIPSDRVDERPVAANMRGLLWTPVGWSSGVDESSVSLYDVTTETPVSVPVTVSNVTTHTYLVAPAVPLNPDSTYRFEGRNFCFDSISTYTFATGEAAALPSTLGTLSASALEKGWISLASYDGGCSAAVVAGQIQISLELSAAAIPWQSSFIYSTYVDGRRWAPTRSLVSDPTPGGSWMGRGSDLIFTICDGWDPDVSEPGVGPGTHSVVMRAQLPGFGAVFESSELWIDIECAEDVSIGGTGSGDSGGAPERRGLELQNQPNPFNPSTTVSFLLPEAGEVALTVYDVSGRRVRTLFDGDLPEGPHEFVWQGRDEMGVRVASGVYVCELNTGQRIETRRMALLK